MSFIEENPFVTKMVALVALFFFQQFDSVHNILKKNWGGGCSLDAAFCISLQLDLYHMDIRLQNQVQATCQDVSWKPIVPAL